MNEALTYPEKLKDPRWQRVKCQVLVRDDFTCRSCGCTTRTLHVHHRWYGNSLEPWLYPLDALVTLCDQCHSFEEVAEPIGRNSDFWPLIRMSDGTFRKGPKAEIVGRWDTSRAPRRWN